MCKDITSRKEPLKANFCNEGVDANDATVSKGFVSQTHTISSGQPQTNSNNKEQVTKKFIMEYFVDEDGVVHMSRREK
jgi:hypothetical protein